MSTPMGLKVVIKFILGKNELGPMHIIGYCSLVATTCPAIEIRPYILTLIVKNIILIICYEPWGGSRKKTPENIEYPDSH